MRRLCPKPPPAGPQADIDKLRSAGDAAAIASEQFAPRPARNNAGDVMDRVLKGAPAVAVPLDEQPVGGAGAMQAEPSLGPEGSAGPVHDELGLDAGARSYDDGAEAPHAGLLGLRVI